MPEYTLEKYVGTDCVGCGSCVAVCPYDAIAVKIQDDLVQPLLDRNRCSKCDLCVENCPVFRNKYLEPIRPDVSRIVGKPYRSFIGFANNNRIRANGSSGGVATALLKHLLDEEEIDYIITAHQHKLIAQPVILKESKDLFDVQGSIYFPSFITEASREILSNPGKCAVVGLPCQIDSLRRMEATRKRLREKVYVHLGLFCSHINEYWYLRYLSSYYKGLGCNPLAVSSRHGSWPGSINLETSCGSITIPHPKVWGNIPLLHLSSPFGCLFCDNHMNTNSDIALGTLRVLIPRVTNKKDIGKSVVTAYTKHGLTIIEDAKRKGEVSLKEISAKALIGTQIASITAKYLGVPMRRKIIRHRHMMETISGFPINYVLISLLPMINSYLGRRSELRRMLYKYRLLERLLNLYQTKMQRLLLKATSKVMRISTTALHEL
ncbi:MAG: Coenzyme F420 hydrogenase/dehydrogenase, beta subunit C-terminal domain [Candidatus Bathyarchaeota archaeon]|nr:MAG: Coenzyme F420 hydrogenase/dehydrogenase, beta subunit C-terminal domain [Candidatus Bathyarchaeota archaeon]